MTHHVLETAINEGIPFVINMADGRQYEVHDRLSIALGSTNVVVLDERSCPHVLPLLTMTGVSYLAPGDAAAK